MGHKLGDYSLVDDQIIIEARFYLIDSLSMKKDDEFTYTVEANFNNDILTLKLLDTITLKLMGNEEPKLQINASFLEDTSVEFVSG